jgi:ComF family protein
MFASRPVLAWPSQCAVCRGWSRARLCPGCIAAHRRPAPRCGRCAIDVPAGQSVCGACLLDPPPQEATIAAVDYHYPWDQLIRQFKFHAALDLAAPLADRLAAAVQEAGAALPHLLLPAPLAPPRLRERGYNQSAVLAKRLARRLGLRAEPRLLLRVRDTVRQADLPRAARVDNVRNAYAIDPLHRAEVTGRHVGVVDDVLTTGASASEMARTLLQAGADRVSVWVVARTPAPDLPGLC